MWIFDTQVTLFQDLVLDSSKEIFVYEDQCYG